MTMTTAIPYENHIPDVLQALQQVEVTMAEHGLDPLLVHLVKLRASQINSCGFCVKMHIREARADGETDERLERLVVWRHVDDYSERERAALKWTEALTTLKEDTDYGALRAELKALFSEAEISVLTSTIMMINLWNRMKASQH
ncbi:carboxymuconolactone decarboxylase family protein [Emcibacter nanhaiensis]|uniref:Carboxymuconolactone decarboxylase family protein n=2 Tax=Emcibacter nanhaiensis TaxID=1505037 RepID=A0A501PML8_9PROT|nr:carboxymuconolactone decarboxylase family protein [Emcibacter nanhaiensis]TPD61740.1 carboxymuconolactone decarboxylase family protein [Emcibacter nanhaiensis]